MKDLQNVQMHYQFELSYRVSRHAIANGHATFLGPQEMAEEREAAPVYGADDEQEDADEPSQFHGFWVWGEEANRWRIIVRNIEELIHWRGHNQRPSWHYDE